MPEERKRRFGRLRERHNDRKQRRGWRRERRRGKRVDAYDAVNQAESDMSARGGFFTKQ